jgi:adenosine kinase
MYFPGRFKEHILPDQIDRLSVSFLVNKMDKRYGGVAPNIAYTLAILGGRPVVLGAAGEDFGDYRSWLDANNVDTSAIVEIPDEFTASCFINSDIDNNQIVSFYSGAMRNSCQLSVAQNVGEDVDLVVISPDDPGAMVERVKECKNLSIPYVYDPSQQIIWLTAEQLAEGIQGCFLLIVNEYEFGMIREKTGWTEDKVLSLAGGLVITRGKEGSHVRIEGKEYHVPIVPPTEIVDPTGVGDAFRGGMLRGYAMGLPWDISCRMGSLASTFVLEKLGTQSHSYTCAEFVTRYRQHFDDDGALDALLT